MKKKIMAAAIAAVVIFALGGCAENSVGGNEALTNEGASDSVGEVTANDAVQSMAESMAQSMFESMTRDMEESVTEGTTVSTTAVTTKKETETTTVVTTDKIQLFEELKRTEFLFVRTSEDESRTLTIDSEIFPYDCEEIIINVDTEAQNYVETEGYEYLDLENLEKYPNLKRLEIADTNNTGGGYIKIINGGSASGSQILEEISLRNVTWWEEDWLSGISSLKTLSVRVCYEYDGRFLENLSQVETLHIGTCPIDDLSFINGMSSLRELTVQWAEINNTSFDGVYENYSVKRLIIDDNFSADSVELTDITGVSKLQGLEYLELPMYSYRYGEKQIEELQEMLPACEINY